MPTGDALTTSEWSTSLLPTNVWLIVEAWLYYLFYYFILFDSSRERIPGRHGQPPGSSRSATVTPTSTPSPKKRQLPQIPQIPAHHRDRGTWQTSCNQHFVRPGLIWADKVNKHPFEKQLYHAVHVMSSIPTQCPRFTSMHLNIICRSSSSLVQVMACCLSGMGPLPEPMLTHQSCCIFLRAILSKYKSFY